MDDEHHEDAHDGRQNSGGDVIEQGPGTHFSGGPGVQLRHPYRGMKVKNKYAVERDGEECRQRMKGNWKLRELLSCK